MCWLQLRIQFEEECHGNNEGECLTSKFYEEVSSWDSIVYAHHPIRGYAEVDGLSGNFEIYKVNVTEFSNRHKYL